MHVLLAVISDIHGNLPALEAVLGELEQDRPDELVCLGDVALGPWPAETLARVRALECTVVRGNWDGWLVDGFPPAPDERMQRFIEQGEWWARMLSAEDREFVATFAPRTELELEGVRMLCFHGSPASYDEVILATTPHEELLATFAGFDHSLLLGGHTHAQLTRVVEGRLLVNPGSVGLPFRGFPLGGPQPISPWAEYGLVRLERGRFSVELRRTSYDVEAMLRHVIDSGVPHADWWADAWERDLQAP